MTTGGSGMDVGPDSVTAKLTVDVPNEAVTTLHQLAMETEKFRVQMEAAVRAEKDFIEAIGQMPEIADRASTAQQNMGERLAQGWGLQGREPIKPGMPAAPQGSFIEPFAGAMLGMGLGGMAGSIMGADHLTQQMGAMKGADPRTFQLAQFQRGAMNGMDDQEITAKFSDEQLKKLSESVGRRAAPRPAHSSHTPASSPPGGGRSVPGEEGHSDVKEIVSAMMSEMAPGGSHSHTLRTASDIMKKKGADLAEGETDEEGNTSQKGQFGKALGIGGGAAGSLLGLNELIQKGGAMYQSYKNMGTEQGGDVGAGFSSEMSIRTMALNPFITTEQARTMVQGALSRGYKPGTQEYDSVLEFVKHNLTDMNMDIGQSFQFVQQGVQEGHESFADLRKALDSLKESAKNGNASVSELTKSLGDLTSVGTNAGMRGSGLGQFQSAMGSVISSMPKGAQDALTNISGSMLQNPTVLMQAGQGVGVQATTPGAMAEELSKQGKTADAIIQWLTKIALTVKKGGGDTATQHSNFAIQLQAYFGGQVLNAGQAADLYDALLDEAGATQGANNDSDLKKAYDQVMSRKKPKQSEGFGHTMGSAIAGFFGQGDASWKPPSLLSQFESMGSAVGHWLGWDGSSGQSDGSDESQAQGEPTPAQQPPGQGTPTQQQQPPKPQQQPARPSGDQTGPGSVTHTIQLQPMGGLEHLIQTPPPVQLTSGQQKVIYGYGNYTNNNIPPGEGWGR